jgi:hypothetical protein
VIEVSAITNTHKRSRSLDHISMKTIQNHFIAAGGEQGVHKSISDPEYNSDVIVVGQGRKYPRISETPPNYDLSEMRNIAAPPTPPLPIPPEIPEPGLLEWYPAVTEQSCSHAAEISELKSRVTYLGAETFMNIELRSRSIGLLPTSFRGPRTAQNGEGPDAAVKSGGSSQES